MHDAHGVRHEVTQGPGHGQPWRLLTAAEDPVRQIVLQADHLATGADDAPPLLWVLRFVVRGCRHELHIGFRRVGGRRGRRGRRWPAGAAGAAGSARADAAGVACPSDEHLLALAVDDGHGERRPAQRDVEAFPIRIVLDRVVYKVEHLRHYIVLRQAFGSRELQQQKPQHRAGRQVRDPMAELAMAIRNAAKAESFRLAEKVVVLVRLLRLLALPACYRNSLFRR
mmetsp:Transcript_73327/g.184813  ORF Transcript_73327/g.184813 Transcript_73327/m.184813 type:complete len:226 (+) Transcript_73327:413-1090(+)